MNKSVHKHNERTNTWALTTGGNIFVARIKIKILDAYEETLDLANKLLKEKYGVFFSTLKLEQECQLNSEPESIDYIKYNPGPQKGSANDS